MAILMVAIMSVGFMSCSKDDDSSKDESTHTDYVEEMTRELTGTSWRYDKLVNGTETRAEYAIITFAENRQLQVIDYETEDGNYISTKDGVWYFDNNFLVFLCNVPGNMSYTGYMATGLGVNHSISSISPSSMILVDPDGKKSRYFTKVAYKEIDDDAHSGDTSNREPPYVTSFDFSATKTSITVKFMCSEKPNKASIMYGEGSATKTLSSSIAGKQVSATATGLKSGTKYYFKCTVSNQNGSSTSDGWPATTNY